MTRNFKAGDVVKHFKRETLEKATDKYLYLIIGESIHTETKEKLMTYQSLYEDKDMEVKKFQIFSRPYDMFMSKVDKEKYPDIKQEYRFELFKNKEK